MGCPRCLDDSDSGKCMTCHTEVDGEAGPGNSSAESVGSIAWVPFTEMFPMEGQSVLAYREKTNPQLAYQTIKFTPGDEADYTHWAALNPPK